MTEPVVEPEHQGGQAFSEEERKALRTLMEEDRRAKWAWRTARIWVGYAAAIVAAIYAIRDYIKGAFMGMIH